MNYALILSALLVSAAVALPISNLHSPGKDMDTEAKLKELGYMKLAKSLEEGLRNFQIANGLKVSGTVTAETLAYLAKPHCGNNETVVKDGSGFRYNIDVGAKWDLTKDLTWCLHNYPSWTTMTNAEVLDVLNEAFQVWQPLFSINFVHKRTCDNVDIFLSFGGTRARKHYTYNNEDGRFDEASRCGYNKAFGRKSGTLAHAFYPKSGNVHFDDAEHWTEGTDHEGTNLRMVAIHEYGHMLGLSHSNTPGAIMLPFYQGYEPREGYRLPRDEQKAIYHLYYDVIIPDRRKRDLYEDALTPEICDPSIRIKQIFDLPGDHTYLVANNNKVYRYDGKGIDRSYNSDYSAVFKGAPSAPDAVVYSHVTQEVLLFKGTDLYRGTFGEEFAKSEITGATGTKVSGLFISPQNELLALMDGKLYVLDAKSGAMRLRGGESELIKLFNTDFSDITPEGIEGAYSKLSDGGQSVNFLLGNSYYLAKVIRGDMPLKYYVPTGYPKTIKELIGCGNY